ncbi:hypothetical protein P879_05724 [Paragonimus westermani]|uniref:Uncharacterized protein n=1 Tax=Paragonimus westermani TaxID=34504 RepID=A0A8T0DRZ2_9TREM|nr:hypothetical protein P879_05724 [Paragonimus westermani]
MLDTTHHLTVISTHVTPHVCFKQSINTRCYPQPQQTFSYHEQSNQSIQIKMTKDPIKIYQPLDFSFFDLKEPFEILKCEPRICTGLPLKCPKTKEGKWLTQTLKATNNQLEDMTEIPEVVAELFGCYEWITWLDLSCNKIASVAPVSQAY